MWVIYSRFADYCDHTKFSVFTKWVNDANTSVKAQSFKAEIETINVMK